MGQLFKNSYCFNGLLTIFPFPSIIWRERFRILPFFWGQDILFSKPASQPPPQPNQKDRILRLRPGKTGRPSAAVENDLLFQRTTCTKVRNETETKRNETKHNETKWNKTKRNGIKLSEMKWWSSMYPWYCFKVNFFFPLIKRSCVFKLGLILVPVSNNFKLYVQNQKQQNSLLLIEAITRLFVRRYSGPFYMF